MAGRKKAGKGVAPRARRGRAVPAKAREASLRLQLARARNEAREALERQTATAEILKVIARSPSDVQPVFDAIVASAMQLLKGATAHVTRLEGGSLRLAAYSKTDAAGAAALNRLYPLDVAGTPAAVALEKQVPLIVSDIEKDERMGREVHATMRARGVRSFILVPLVSQGVSVGTLVVNRREAGDFTAHEVGLLRTFADQAVIAIENVRLFNETKGALERQTATSEILKVIAGSPADVQPVFEAILGSAVNLCGAEIAAVFPYDGKRVHLAATHNWSDEAKQYFANIYPSPPSEQLISGRTILSCSVVRIEDAAADPHYDPNSVATGRWRRMLGVPIVREGRPLGAMVVTWREPGETPQAQVDLLQTFADQAAIAIENVRLFNETREALERQTATAEILKVIADSPSDVQPVFDAIAANAVRLSGGQCAVFRYDGELVHVVALDNVTPDAGKAIRAAYPQAPSGNAATTRAIQQRTMVHIADVARDPDYAMGDLAQSANYRSILSVPMIRAGEPVGAITVTRVEPGGFPEQQVAMLRSFADQAVIAIENARLFREIQDKSRQLEIANQHKSEFLANMSHELRTPLNAIIGFSEVLIEKMFGEVNEKQLDYLNDIHSSGRHLLSLINDILDLSKIEAGRMELDAAEFDLRAALGNALTLVKERAQRSGVELALEVDPSLGAFRADERKFKQIMLNLLSNAVKFTPAGGKVTVRARPVERGAREGALGGALEVAVADTGVGIAPQDREAVFEEFRQVGRDYTRKAEGTGLGLALVRKFVELHGGAIGLESEPGKGSTFTFTIPNRP